MSTFADDIEDVTGLEAIEAVVIGTVGYGEGERHEPGNARAGEVLPWHVARPLLDYEYDCGYGGADCPQVYVYTETRVIFVHEYDGSTCVVSVPRNPTAEDPGEL